MSKAYPSNLTQNQYELISDLIPEAKSGGRPRSVDMREVLNAIFYILVEGVRWRALPGDFPAIALRAFKKGKQCTPISVTGAKREPGCSNSKFRF